MSRFGLGMMGDFEDDPFFGSHVRQMNQMMNSMFADPFGLMGPPALTNDPRHQQVATNPMPGMQMMPFGFPVMPSLPMGRMFAGLGNMNQDQGPCHSFTSSSIMTMTSSGPDGRPQVYQETMSTRSAPGGVKETKKTVSDSRTGTRSLAIGHHIGERAHILEREHNLHSGEQEERQEYINLDEEEAETFNHEWEARTKRSAGAIAGSLHRTAARNPYSRSQPENKLLALPSTTSLQSKSQSRPLATRRPSIRPTLSSRKSSAKSSCRSTAESSASASTSTDPKTTWTPSPDRDSNLEDSTATTTTATTSATTSPATAGSSSSRKREHSPEPTPVQASASPNKRQSRSSQEPIPCIDVTD